MQRLELVLVEWPSDPVSGGPRVLGRTADPDLLASARERIAAGRLRELARLRTPVRALDSEGHCDTSDREGKQGA